MLAKLEKQEIDNDSHPLKTWYAVIIRSGRERDAADGFRREGVTAYWPNYNKRVDAGGRNTLFHRRRAILTAIIPGYLFSPTSDGDAFWPAAQRVPGFLNVVRGFGGEVSIMNRADIDIIREIEAAQNLPPPIRPEHNFKPGQKVRFVDDILGRWPAGSVSRLLPDGRIGVDVYLMARVVPFTVLPHQIEGI